MSSPHNSEELGNKFLTEISRRTFIKLAAGVLAGETFFMQKS